MTAYRPLIEELASVHSLDPDLVEAVVMQESQGCADAFRFEPGYYTKYLKGNPDYAGEIPRRVSSSYGLMQVMLPTARMYGFSGEPEALFAPRVALTYGCKHLANLLKWAKGDVARALEAYNGGKGHVDGVGADAVYATEVLRRLSTMRAHPTTPHA